MGEASDGASDWVARVIWRSSAACVLDKPSGLPTQAPAAYPSLESWWREQTPGYVAFPHRLDRPVSGCVLVALSKRAARLLSQQFEARKVVKRYLAWVSGDVIGDEHVWHDWICKVAGQAKAQCVGEVTTPTAMPPADGIASDEMLTPKEAITNARVLRRSEAGTLLLLQPLTGRMHQLRLQCSVRGCPIIGDGLYDSDIEFAGSTACGDRAAIALHAWQLRFADPISGKATEVQSLPSWTGAYAALPALRSSLNR